MHTYMTLVGFDTSDQLVLLNTAKNYKGTENSAKNYKVLLNQTKTLCLGDREFGGSKESGLEVRGSLGIRG